ncbi:hypothetical protein COMNV_01626 [Commensalibacter sp. Nvir]|uniref:glycosyltransferase family 2 protein n=1 Tax=Commensalibacter sp. Nvir TaxID=3069817 RepID=UPI002D6DBDFD|nr:hypothetical protein COMNV_01626 [Commensalibacter sp. Nvir]
MEKSLPTVAVALFVRNEFSDISGWISWYFALGVKTLFIFDDHSTDGTWEILQAATKCYDIRLFRTDPIQESWFYLRQRDSFLKAVELCKGYYDWLAFLDADEYLYLKHFDTLPEFLDQFKDADAVAFNWRIYGHGHTVLRPKKAVVESFLRHSLPTFGANELIKSFFRPENHTGKYITPHWIEDIDPNRYFKPNNTKVTRIGSSQDVDWSDAFVMHYICRSMEHFTQRVKVRPDTSGCWGGYNTIDLEDKEPLRLMPKVNEIMASIYEQQFKDAIDLIRGVGVEKKKFIGYNKKMERTLSCTKSKSNEVKDVSWYCFVS